MAIVYKKCIVDGEIPPYMCDPCGNEEKGRVRGAAFIHKSLRDDIDKASTEGGVKNIESKTWWETQMLAGLIKVIPTTRGTYDGGTPNMVSGFGNKKETKASKTHTLIYNDRNHTGNDDFYNALEQNAEEWMIGWRTDKELRVGMSPLTGIDAKDAVEEDVDSLVLWEVTCTWDQTGSKKNVPIYKLGDIADVFECVDEEASNP